MVSALSRLSPWTDRNGRLSLLRAVVFVGLLVPAVLLLRRAAIGDLGPRPLAEAIHVAGDWAVRFLLAAVTITPLRALSGEAKLIGVRRMIGLAALAYAGLHVSLWAVDLGLDPAQMATEILVRPYLTIGFVAVLGLVGLGATSTDGAIRRLGAAWRRLHLLVHPILILALVHLFLQSKLDLAQGTILTAIAFAGLAVRMIGERRLPLGPAAVVAAGAAAFLGGATAEAVWYTLKTGRPIVLFLAADFSFAARVPPVWWGVAIAVSVAGAAVVLRHSRRRGGQGAKARSVAGPEPLRPAGTAAGTRNVSSLFRTNSTTGLFSQVFARQRRLDDAT